MDDTTILVADEQTLVRELLSNRLGREVGLTVVGHVADANDAVEAVAFRRPDILLIDADLPGLGCFQAIRKIRTGGSMTQAVVMSPHASDLHVHLARRHGASGCISKDGPFRSLLEAIRVVASGEAHFVTNNTTAPGDTGVPETRSLAALTMRELEVLTHVAEGLPKKEIAKRMFVSVKTVDKHVEHVMSKLDIHDRVGLARLAIREGLIQP